ncbi:hypothetical protein DL766_004827 [Monosporascus sp. MC13-8B]|uniref:Uncharacterized protein n=1 Tax=Monosporascus cannonballus TaxID=155416 RepID=A0ABY0HGT3_9PEZI|nr:hypothetical protein DL762_001264 [Monosporascus cannonballus]RYO99697.1 hypothetical protein DL763_001305 [Monosporascus cannonballus]RYP30555.1 hypothetical protein DL766_004827 [Monosporascus sp. MC13-8B]
MELMDSKLQDRDHDGSAISAPSANAAASPGNAETVGPAKPPFYGRPFRARSSWNGGSTGIFAEDEHLKDASPLRALNKAARPGTWSPPAPAAVLARSSPVTPAGACSEAVRREAAAASRNAASVKVKGGRAATTGLLKHIANPRALLEDYD